MTHFATQLELNLMTEPELYQQLRETFNAIAMLERSTPEFGQAAATLEDVKRALRRRAHSPKL